MKITKDKFSFKIISVMRFWTLNTFKGSDCDDGGHGVYQVRIDQMTVL